MQAQSESKDIALFILSLGPRCGMVVNMTPWSLYPQDSALAPIVQEAGWVPGPVWTGDKNLAATTRVQTPNHPDHRKLLY